jgi:aminoglycoside 3-N-acetyltransferase
MIVDQLRALGVRAGGTLLVHSSFRAVRVGTPSELISALRIALGPDGTLVMPTMTAGDEVFDPATTPTFDMGIVAETFWRRAGVLRSTHPGASFAAIGPNAARVCAPQPLSPPHGVESPVGVVHALDGQVLLLGVTHSEDTTCHLAEAIAGVPYSISYPTVVAPGVTELIAESDHCSVGFRQLDEWLGDRQRTGPVGNAGARLADSRAIVEVAVAQLRANPLVFLCPAGECEECDQARESISN